MLGGLVDVPLMLSFSDLITFPSTTMDCIILCAGNPHPHPVPESHTWQGVRFTTLLAEVQMKPGTRCAHLFASDGYRTCVDLSELERGLLAYRRDHAAPDSDNGHPVRVIIPGLYGYKMPKSIQRIILADAPLSGTWEKRGWPAKGDVQPTVIIQEPRCCATIHLSTRLSGVAFAGEDPVTAVEISVDDSPWMPVPFIQAKPNAWAHWSIAWTAPAPGAYTVRARAASPVASSTIHSIIVQVEE